MQFKDEGRLLVRTFSASGALPIANATVHVYGVNEENRDISYSLKTDIDGVSEVISLPAPSVIYSLSPSAKEQPYANYNIEIRADGYYTKIIENASVFSGVETLMSVGMIPLTLTDSHAPASNLVALVTENENLE